MPIIDNESFTLFCSQTENPRFLYGRYGFCLFCCPIPKQTVV